MTDQTDDKSDFVDKFIDMGSELAGVTAAGVAMAVFKADAGAATALGAAGVVLTHVLREICMEVKGRVLGNREELRVGAAFVFAAKKIEENRRSGQQIRQDGFFQEQPNVRAPAKEILEGVLLAAQREHQEKKLKYIGNIFANAAFMEGVSAEQANWLLQKAQELTYRQLCILALTEQKEHRSPSWGPANGDPAFGMEYRQLMDMLAYDETLEDYYRGHHDSVGELSRVAGLNRIGRFIYTVMGLEEIPEDDLRKLAPRFPRAFAA